MTDQQIPAWQGDGTIWNSPALLVAPVRRAFEVYDLDAHHLGSITPAAAAIDLNRTSATQLATVEMAVTDTAGHAINLTRPPYTTKIKVIVADPAGDEIGQVGRSNIGGKPRFHLEAAGHRYGGARQENLRATKFSVTDEAGEEVCRIQRPWDDLARAPLPAGSKPTGVVIHRRLEDPLRLLTLAAALAVAASLL